MSKLNISVICIGDELLKGFTVNTNLTDIGQAMTNAGLIIHEAEVIPDTKNAIIEMIERLFNHNTDIIITSGGLGPTVDDLTKQTIAGFLELPLKHNEDIVASLKKYWGQRSQPMPDSLLSQALIPEGAKWFPNEVGTAPGILIKAEKFKKSDTTASPITDHRLPTTNICTALPQHCITEDFPCIIMLPGPPSELNPMFKKYVLPFLESIEPEKRFTETIHVFGLSESVVESRTEDIIASSKDISIAYCASPEAVKVYLSSSDQDILKATKIKIKAVLKDRLLPDGVVSPAEYIVKIFKEKNLTLACAESCTGGMIAAAITDIPGSSAIFKGSLVTYSNEWKENLLKVPKNILIEYGAVSSECAEAMVENLCLLYDSDAGISITGIAGPDGGTSEKPVGLVYIGVKFKDKTVVKQYNFPGGRERIRRRTVSTALNILVDLVKNYD
jgi:PncC family amidohydrolase